MAKKTYAEKLRDPRWQKKRLEILERDKWMCRRCHNKKITLHVHHLNYIRGKEPWEYEPDQLLTLCEYCHQNEREFREEGEEALLDILKTQGWLASEVFDIYEIFRRLGDKALSEKFKDSFIACILSSDFKLAVEKIMEVMPKRMGIHYEPDEATEGHNVQA